MYDPCVANVAMQIPDSIHKPIYAAIDHTLWTQKLTSFQHCVDVSSWVMTHVWDSATKYNAVNSFIKQYCIAPRCNIILRTVGYFVDVNCLGLCMSLDTIDFQYITVIYNTIIRTNNSYNFGQIMHSRTTPHILPSRPSYEVSFEESFKEIWLRYIESAVYLYMYNGITSFIQNTMIGMWKTAKVFLGVSLLRWLSV